MDKATSKTCLKSNLVRELADFRITASPLNPGFDFEKILSEVIECRVVKENNRRQVYHLQTNYGGYFFKRSTLVRAKDRLRHFLLPRRRWAEWRNLHRLRYAQVPVARPLAKGQPKISHPKSYFLLTEQVPGTHIPVNSLANAQRLGRYAAFLHRRGIYHSDLNRKNFILNPAGRFYLLDAQQVYFLSWMPRRMRINNLGRIFFNLCSLDDPEPWGTKFLEGYNQDLAKKVNVSEVIEAAWRHRHRRYRSRSKRCCKNSTDFEILKSRHLQGYKRRGFNWGAQELQQAEEKGKPLKGAHVIGYQGICIKKHRRKFLHQNRCLISWKMSRALEVRGIPVPRALGYFKIKSQSYFLAELLDDRLHLNAYLSAISDERVKRQALKKLALWLRTFHDTNVWQRDFKSSNILCRDSDYFMVDLDGIRIRRLGEQNKIYNLAQLNASVSNTISIKDRLRFYHYYSADFQPTRQQRRTVYGKVWDITKTKNTKIYDLDFAELLESQIKAGPNKRI
ncbi:MAG: lipopolysaccharide kinase InaA family protein [Deltaproteobacteria bacterium]|nr:lipopolysaccharide kinase InaA family protein [Deltaproteobacteria bacterium]